MTPREHIIAISGRCERSYGGCSWRGDAGGAAGPADARANVLGDTERLADELVTFFVRRVFT